MKHVAKNQGAPHLRSVAVDLPFYALYNLDVWAFLSTAALVGIYLSKTILKFLVLKLWKSTDSIVKRKRL